MMPENIIKWTPEQEQWLIDNYDICPVTQIHKQFNEKFGTDRTYSSIRAKFTRLGLKSDLIWTEEEESWLIDNFHKLGGVKTPDEFYKRFNKRRGYPSIRAKALNLGLKADAETVKRNKNYVRRVPIGTIIDDGEGYLKIKTGNGSSGWERLHRYIWENYNGPLPDGYKIFFLDGNKRNLRIDNLVAVPAEFHAIMNKLGWNKDDRDSAKAGLAWCALNKEIRDKRKE